MSKHFSCYSDFYEDRNSLLLYETGIIEFCKIQADVIAMQAFRVSGRQNCSCSLFSEKT